MLPELTQRLRREWPRWFPNELVPTDIAYLGITGSIEGGTTTFLGFRNDCAEPRLAVKIHRDRDAVGRVRNEQAVLSDLQSGAASLAASVPRVLLAEAFESTWALVQSILPGWPMPATLTADGHPDLAEAERHFAWAATWLTELYRTTRRQGREVARVLHDQLEQTIATALTAFDVTPTERACIDGVRMVVEPLAQLGGGMCHGDFCRHNLLVNTHAAAAPLGVIDWTFGRRRGFPLHDLLFFAATYFFQLRQEKGLAGFTKAFHYTFFDTNDYAHLVRRHLRHYCERIGIPPPLRTSLFAGFLLQQMVFEVTQRQQCLARGGMPRFAVALAMEAEASLTEMLRVQLWRSLFRIFVEQSDQCPF